MVFRIELRLKDDLSIQDSDLVNLSGIVFEDYANEDPALETPKRKWENPPREMGKEAMQLRLRNQEQRSMKLTRNVENNIAENA
ncbi:hypothetical protein L1987_19072 [Smallanthus sonchifolius]|uniref:Uncharacterized protein n=1 Tax=Smallanthus sonchifolius TaxID=185202 RepID=A0ACB9J3N3_9ASTR|nr:hypothetical protein L1987_19072 [Smallanthus sonchifolius]